MKSELRCIKVSSKVGAYLGILVAGMRCLGRGKREGSELEL